MAMGMYSAMLRATGDALTPGLISVLVCALDVVFNFFLINPTRQLVLFGQSVTVWGAGLSVPGAALGTALSTVVGGLLALGVLLLRDGPLCIRKPGSWRITSACLRNLWRWVHRWPLSVRPSRRHRCFSSGSSRASARWPSRPTASASTPRASATWQATAFRTPPSPSSGRPSAPPPGHGEAVRLVLHGNGHGHHGPVGHGALALCPGLMGIFTADAAVIALGAQVLRIEAFAEPMFGASIVASGAMQGAGDSTGCFVLNLFSMWGVRLTLAFLLAPRLGLVGVWAAMCIELCIRGALFLIRLARGKWLDKGALQ